MNDSVNASAMLCCYVVSAGSEQAASLTNDVLPCSCCTDVFALRFKLVAADPVAYYNILESACRSAVRGQEGSSSHNNSREPGSSSRSSGQGQENSIRKLGGKKSKGSGSRSKRSSSVCKAENASKGIGEKGARVDTNSNSSSSRAESSEEHAMVWSIFMQVLKLLDPPDVVDKSGEQFVLRTWQHYKAYLSAHSSWYKASTKLVPLLVVRGLEVGLTAREKRDFTRILGSPPEASDPEEGEKAPEHADAAEAVIGSPRERQQQQQQQQGWQAQQHDGWQVQQQEQEQQQHGGEAQQQQGWQGQQHEGWQVQQEEQEQHHDVLGDQQLLPSDSGGMSTADTIELQLVLGKTRILVALGRSLISKLAGSEEACEGGNEPITCSSSSSKGGDTSIAGNSSQGAVDLNSGGLSSSSSSSNTSSSNNCGPSICCLPDDLSAGDHNSIEAQRMLGMVAKDSLRSG